jgi:hypothetical protein
VLGKSKQVYSTTKYEGIVYNPTQANLLQLLTAALIAAPIIIFLVIAIIVGVIGFLMYLSSREKSLTGTPAMQGRLGGKMVAGRGGSALPIADEPLQQHKPNVQAEPAKYTSPAVQQPVQQRQPTPLPSQQRPPADATLVSGPVASAPSGEAGATMLSFAAQPMPRAVLTVLNIPAGIQASGSMIVNQSPFIIGRTQGLLNIPDGSISRQHVQIDYNESSRTFTITDLNSSNGTRLNNQVLTAGQRMPLPSGSQIGLGMNTTIRFDLI